MKFKEKFKYIFKNLSQGFQYIFRGFQYIQFPSLNLFSSFNNNRYDEIIAEIDNMNLKDDWDMNEILKRNKSEDYYKIIAEIDNMKLKDDWNTIGKDLSKTMENFENEILKNVEGCEK